MFSFSVDALLLRSSSPPSEGGVGSGVDGNLSRAIAEALPQIHPDKRRSWYLSLTVSGLLIAIFAWLCFFRPFGETATKDFSNVFNTSVACAGALASVICALARKDANRSWRLGCLLFGLGWAANAIGESLWLIVETWQRHTLPSPSLADAWFVASYVLLLASLVPFYNGTRHTKRASIALDSALLAGIFGALAWFFVLQPVWLARDAQEPIVTCIALFYPLFDVFLLCGALALAHTSTEHGTVHRAGTLIACATVFYACADLWYAYLEVSGTYSSGGPNDLAIGISYIGAVLAMLAIAWDREKWPNIQVTKEEEVDEEEIASLSRMLLPYLCTLCVFALIACHQWVETGTLGFDTLLWCISFLAIIMIRQMVSFSENIRLAHQLRELNTGLDKQVRSRTRQIDALLQLTKAVNASLVESDVLQQAVSSARRAVPMSVAAVWNWQEITSSVQLVVAEGNLTGGPVPMTATVLYETLGGKSFYQLVKEVARSGEARDYCGDDLAAILAPSANKKKTPAPLLHLEPIQFNGRILGVLGALRASDTRPAIAFSDEETRLLENVGLEVGTALENARTYARAVEAVDRDPATSLLNHRAMQVHLEAVWERAQKKRTPLSVVMMDLNNFKNFNDVYGHATGDEVLRLVAKVLTETCRGDDFVARYGGDEFFMLLPETDATGALRVAQRLQKHMSQVEFRPAGSQESLPITLSFGVATAPDDAHSKTELIAAADKNLYIAKGSREAIRSTSRVHQRQLAMLGDDGVAALDAMVTAVSNADAYTRQHSEDVTEYALWIADEFGLDDKMRHTIEVGGMLHDVGKICVPQDVLKKPGRLTDAEFAAMQTHPSMGALLVGAVLPDPGVLQIVRSHHERYDGKGYPDALTGDDIPFLGRLVAVADAFSAMTTSRPYRKALSFEQARQEIERGIGTQFDPKLADAFIRALDKRNPGEENPIPTT
ncbi:diguanylate cyclase [bacterium]|nr:MAG: diguanylate cyclase [bacterium]